MEAKTINNPSILIVDDSSINAKILSSWCTKWGFLADTVFTGKSAIEKISVHDYSLIILDVLLPDISGIDIYRKLQTIKYKADIIFQSGLSKTEFKSRINTDTLFLQKPYYPVQMKELVEFLFDKNSIKMLA
ncbi:response regulator [Roseivirga sp.]|uniref:response regulator n=1 Tax=Roseivirga sp. TaxID=1964215 RepID=UPI003B8D7731